MIYKYIAVDSLWSKNLILILFDMINEINTEKVSGFLLQEVFTFPGF